MADNSPSGGHRTLTERLEAEQFRAGQYETIEVATPGVTDINSVIPEAIPPLGVRLDSWGNVYLRGGLYLDFDTFVANDAIDWSGITEQPGTFTVFTVPEGYRPPARNGFGVTLAVAVGVDPVRTYNMASYLRVSPNGDVSLSLGGYLPDGVTTTQVGLDGALLALVVSGDYSLHQGA